MALALYHWLKASSPVLVQTATVFGLIWAALIIGSANLMLRDGGVIASIYGKDPAQAAALWQVLEAVELGIVSGNELIGSLWVLLISIAALRTRGFARIFNYFWGLPFYGRIRTCFHTQLAAFFLILPFYINVGWEGAKMTGQ